MQKYICADVFLHLTGFDIKFTADVFLHLTGFDIKCTKYPFEALLKYGYLLNTLMKHVSV